MTLPAFQLSQPERLYMGGRWMAGHGGRITGVSSHNAAAYRITRGVRTGTMVQNVATYTELKAIILQGGQLS